MNPLYNDFITEHPMISYSHQVMAPLNGFQKELLRDSERGFFIKKSRRAGATTALASFTSWYLYTKPTQYVMYLSSRYDTGKEFVRYVMTDAGNNAYPIRSNQIKFGTIARASEIMIGHRFGLIILDDVPRREMTDAVISTLLPHGLNAIWLCTTTP